jgi:hypothetical protein
MVAPERVVVAVKGGVGVQIESPFVAQTLDETELQRALPAVLAGIQELVPIIVAHRKPEERRDAEPPLLLWLVDEPECAGKDHVVEARGIPEIGSAQLGVVLPTIDQEDLRVGGDAEDIGEVNWAQNAGLRLQVAARDTVARPVDEPVGPIEVTITQ